MECCTFNPFLFYALSNIPLFWDKVCHDTYWIYVFKNTIVGLYTEQSFHLIQMNLLNLNRGDESLTIAISKLCPKRRYFNFISFNSFSDHKLLDWCEHVRLRGISEFINYFDWSTPSTYLMLSFSRRRQVDLGIVDIDQFKPFFQGWLHLSWYITW